MIDNSLNLMFTVMQYVVVILDTDGEWYYVDLPESKDGSIMYYKDAHHVRTYSKKHFAESSLKYHLGNNWNDRFKIVGIPIHMPLDSDMLV